MSEYKSDKELYDQFAEAATALIMRQYATSAGRTVMKTAPIQKTSEELDERCRKQIKRNLRKQQMKVVAKMALRYTKKVAMFIVMLFGIVGILFTTVEAVRVPIINFFIEQKDGYLEITGENDENSLAPSGNIVSTRPLEGLLPDGYEEVLYEKYASGGFTIIYENSRNQYVFFTENALGSNLGVDNEESTSEHIAILSYDAVLIEKGGYRLVWLNTDFERMCCIEADSLSREEVIALAERIENSR